MKLPKKSVFNLTVLVGIWLFWRSLFYIQSFDKFNNFTGTKGKGKICIKTFTFFIWNTRVIFKISKCFFEWIISAIKLIVWNIWNFRLINCFQEKIIKNLTLFIVVWNCYFPSAKFIFSLFENFLEKSGTIIFRNVRLSVTFLIPKLLKQVLLVFFNIFLQKFFLSERFLDFTNLFLILDLFIMALWRSLLINGASFARMYFLKSWKK